MKKIILSLFLCAVLCFASSAPAYAIRIGLDVDVKQAYIGVSTVGSIVDMKTSKVLYRPEKMKSYALKAYNDSIAIKVNGKFYDLNSNYIKIIPATNKDFVSTKNKWYRGELVIYNCNKKLTVINRLPIEYYLLGVVPAEMPSSWHYEAHKAQAIAARSYAIANMNKYRSKGFDLTDTTADQAYGGASSETKRTNKAVMDTKGIVITYKGRVIPAYYHASSGGHTVNSGAAWASDAPYLHSVNGYDSGIKKNGHGVGMSQHGANNLAKKGYSAFSILKYFYNNVDFSRVSS